eukprot:1159589-Pelagomonas_calceolata.AAC.2
MTALLSAPTFAPKLKNPKVMPLHSTKLLSNPVSATAAGMAMQPSALFSGFLSAPNTVSAVNNEDFNLKEDFRRWKSVSSKQAARMAHCKDAHRNLTWQNEQKKRIVKPHGM